MRETETRVDIENGEVVHEIEIETGATEENVLKGTEIGKENGISI